MTNTPMTREAFEAWAKAYYQEQQMTRHPETHYATPDQYILPHYESAWAAWQACEQQNQAVIGGDLSEWLKEGETVIERLTREREDVASSIGMLAKERRKVENQNQTIAELVEALEDADEMIGIEPYEHVAQEAADAHRNIRELIAKVKGK